MNRKITEYQAREERLITVTEYAELLGVHQGDLSHWLKGRRTPGEKVVKKLAANPLIGPEVWEAAGIITDPVVAALNRLPDDLRRRYEAEIMRLADEQDNRQKTSGGVVNFATQ